MIFLTLELASAQTSPAKVNKNSSKGNISKTNIKKKLSLKLDSQKRAYYIDPLGDKVIVLDYKTRKNLQEASKFKKDDPLNNKINSKSFYKETVPDMVEEIPPGFKTYSSKVGDTWESVSLKLYDTDTQWPQLKLWNEELLTELEIPENSTIKYKEISKKK